MRSVPSVYHVAQKVLTAQKKDKQDVPDTRFNHVVSPRKMFGAKAYPLDDFKAIRKAVPGSTINDVVLAVCGGALRRYLQHPGKRIVLEQVERLAKSSLGKSVEHLAEHRLDHDGDGAFGDRRFDRRGYRGHPGEVNSACVGGPAEWPAA